VSVAKELKPAKSPGSLKNLRLNFDHPERLHQGMLITMPSGPLAGQQTGVALDRSSARFVCG
jgi:hypothetical protein